MTVPEVLAISPRIPASCLICEIEPRAPESAIIQIGLYLSKFSFSFLVTSSVVSVQRAMIFLVFSCAEIYPYSYSFVICSTSASALARISFFCGGIVASQTATVRAALVEYLYPRALIRSRTSEVVVVPCIFMQRSMMSESCFLPTRNATSRSNCLSEFVLST